MELTVTDADLSEDALTRRGHYTFNPPPTNPPSFSDFNDAAQTAIRSAGRATYCGCGNKRYDICPPPEAPDQTQDAWAKELEARRKVYYEVQANSALSPEEKLHWGFEASMGQIDHAPTPEEIAKDRRRIKPPAERPKDFSADADLNEGPAPMTFG